MSRPSFKSVILFAALVGFLSCLSFVSSSSCRDDTCGSAIAAYVISSIFFIVFICLILMCVCYLPPHKRAAQYDDPPPPQTHVHHYQWPTAPESMPPNPPPRHGGRKTSGGEEEETREPLIHKHSKGTTVHRPSAPSKAFEGEEEEGEKEDTSSGMTRDFPPSSAPRNHTYNSLPATSAPRSASSYDYEDSLTAPPNTTTQPTAQPPITRLRFAGTKTRNRF